MALICLKKSYFFNVSQCGLIYRNIWNRPCTKSFFFLKGGTVFKVTKTKNKKFFFQQIILIFAVCLENIYKKNFINFLSNSPENKDITKSNKRLTEKWTRLAKQFGIIVSIL